MMSILRQFGQSRFNKYMIIEITTIENEFK